MKRQKWFHRGIRCLMGLHDWFKWDEPGNDKRKGYAYFNKRCVICNEFSQTIREY